MITGFFRKQQQQGKAMFKTGFPCHPEFFFLFLIFLGDFLNNELFLAINDSLG